MVKAGRTREGSRAAGSHTAALAASDVAVDALFHQTGVIRADTIDEMFDIAACLDWQPLPAGRRVAIVTNAGGPGILAVDACVAAGLDVVEFGGATRARLAAFLPPEAAIGNPVDMVASAGADEYRRTVEIALTSDDGDALIVIFTPVDRRKAAETIAGNPRRNRRRTTRRGHGQAGARVRDGRTRALTPLEIESPPERVPVYAFPENAARALGKIATYAEMAGAAARALLGLRRHPRRRRARRVPRGARQPRRRLVDGRRNAARAERFGLPLVARRSSRTGRRSGGAGGGVRVSRRREAAARQLLHKSDIGAVTSGCRRTAAVRSAFEELTALAARTAESIAPKAKAS